MIARNIFKYLANKTVKPLIKTYLGKDRNYRYDDLNIKVLKGVFHPGLFFSTKILIEYLLQFNLKNKTLLELGAGTGLISVFSAKRDAMVTASDISLTAIDSIKINAEKNEVKMRIIHSNLFEKITKEEYDFILINPPYYKKEPQTDDQYAWYCGEHSEYFQKLFKELSEYFHRDSKVIMVLSEECDLEGIKLLAKKNHLEMMFKKKYFRLWEMNLVFEIFKA